MKKFILATIAISLLLGSNIWAKDISLKITNLTKGISLTPFLVSTHKSSSKTFTLGIQASAELIALAEGGDISLLVSKIGTSAQYDNNPNGGLLLAGQSTTANITNISKSNTNLSVLSMLLPTNDAFIGLNNILIPNKKGVYTFYLNAYDAGSEANDELSASIPGPPTGSTGGSGVTKTPEGFVHVHRGTLGDDNSSGGKSDLNISKHRWLNPVAKVTLTVK